MITPLESTIHTEYIPKGNSPASLIKNSFSTITDITSPTIRPKKLSDYISHDFQFLRENKSTLKDYEKFLNMKKIHNTNNNALTIKDQHENVYKYFKNRKFRDNPKLIISSYRTKEKNEIDESQKKYKVNIIGVDEGLIQIPKSEDYTKLYFNNDNSLYAKSLKTKLNDKFIKTGLKEENMNFSPKFNNTQYNFNKNLKLSNDNTKPIVKKSKTINKIFLKTDYNNNLKTLQQFQEQLNYNYEIKKLDSWDFEHLQKNKHTFLSEKLKQILNSAESSQMKWYINIKNDKKQLKIMMRNKYLRNFFDKINQEQKAIYFQNMNVNKKGFNFEVFYKNKNEMQLEDKEKDYLQIRQVDFYRDVMREKLKVEEMFNTEISNSAEEVYSTRVKKNELLIELYEISKKITELLKEKQNITKEYKENIKILNSRIDIIKAIPISNNNNMNNNNFNKNNDSKSVNVKNKMTFQKRKTAVNEIIQNNLFNNPNNIMKLKVIRRNSLFLNKNNANENNDNNGLNNINDYFENFEDQNFMTIDKNEKFQIQSDLISEKTDLENIYRKNIKKINNQKLNLDNKFEDTKTKIFEYNLLYKKTKADLELRVQTLSNYYYQILKRGIDVRNKGLVWVVMKLMELHADVDKHYFPLFLNDDQISYILRVGIKMYELSEYLKLFQILKEKQKVLKDKYVEEYEENYHRESDKKIGKFYLKDIKEIQIKYEKVVNFALNEKREEENINTLARNLKEQILKYQDDDCGLLNSPEMCFIPGSLAVFFAKDKRFRQYFDDVYYLKEEISKRQKEIDKEKRIALKTFRNKYDFNVNNTHKTIENAGLKSNVEENENIYAALFGNGISL